MFDPVLFAALMSSTAAFTPLSLFAAGEQGAWYDPSDLSTMFTDAAGTTPVTAVEQPVGLLLDKSKGLALGAELVTNGDFSSGTTGWSVGAGTMSVVGGALRVSQGAVDDYARAYQAVSCTTGRWYKIAGTLVGKTASNAAIEIQTTTTGTPAGAFSQNIAGASGTFSGYFLATAATMYVWLLINTSTNDVSADFDNISVRELPGNHASQSTAASRPVLSARVNLLTYSEQFDNAFWTKGGLVTAGMSNVTTAPDGTTTADQLIETAASAVHYAEQSAGATTAATNYTASVAIKANGRQYATVSFTGTASTLWVAATFDLSGGGSVSQTGNGSSATYVSSSITSLGSGWFRCTVTGSLTSASAGVITIQPSNSGTPIYGGYSAYSYTGDGTSGIYLWGADLRVTNAGVNLPAYQRVAAATDYDTSGFPLYLKFDGVDDSLATGTIDFSATDKMSVFAGHRFVSGTGSQLICELGTNAIASSGFNLGQGVAAATSGLGFLMNAGSGIGAQTADKSVPYTSVSSLLLNTALSGISNEGILRFNTTPQTYTTTLGTDSGTANFPNKNLYIGNRSGASVGFNGYLYSLIVRGALSTDAQIASTETYVNNLTKAY